MPRRIESSLVEKILTDFRPSGAEEALKVLNARSRSEHVDICRVKNTQVFHLLFASTSLSPIQVTDVVQNAGEAISFLFNLRKNGLPNKVNVKKIISQPQYIKFDTGAKEHEFGAERLHPNNWSRVNAKVRAVSGENGYSSIDAKIKIDADSEIDTCQIKIQTEGSSVALSPPPGKGRGTDDLLRQIAASEKRLCAFLCGVQTYQPTLDPLPAQVMNDMKSFSDFLGRFDSKDVVVEPAWDVDFEGFSDSFNTITNVSGSNDTILVYFSGHGIESDGETYMMLKNANGTIQGNSCVSISSIIEKLNSAAAGTVIFVLDMCNAGSAITSIEGKLNKNWMLFAACQPGEKAYLAAERSHFTRSVLNEMQNETLGKAPISFIRVATEADTTVRRLTEGLQKPFLKSSSGMSGTYPLWSIIDGIPSLILGDAPAIGDSNESSKIRRTEPKASPNVARPNMLNSAELRGKLSDRLGSRGDLIAQRLAGNSIAAFHWMCGNPVRIVAHIWEYDKVQPFLDLCREQDQPWDDLIELLEGKKPQ